MQFSIDERLAEPVFSQLITQIREAVKGGGAQAGCGAAHDSRACW